jgi:hypothetical protein
VFVSLKMAWIYAVYAHNVLLQGYFHTVSDALEIKARTASVNEKITYAAEVSRLLLLSFTSLINCSCQVQSTLRELLVEVAFLHSQFFSIYWRWNI